MFRFSEILQFPDFQERFPGNFGTVFSYFEVFGIFGWIWKRPRLDPFNFLGKPAGLQKAVITEDFIIVK